MSNEVKRQPKGCRRKNWVWWVSENTPVHRLKKEGTETLKEKLTQGREQGKEVFKTSFTPR